MSINLHLPENTLLKPKIVVFGVGGAGCNAVNNMISAELSGVEFVVANTDAQTLEQSFTDKRVQLGEVLTQGLGAGASPEIGQQSAEESRDIIMQYLEGCHMAFITAGMGGGTGTGAAPVIASIAKEKGILTVGVITKPFHFEGNHRMKVAESGLEQLQQYVDTLIVIPNQNLFRIANEKTTFADAFKLADNVLHSGVRGVTDLITMPGLINLDFADIRSVMREMGKAMMGTGEAEGERRAIDAAEAAISNPLLDNVSMKGARGVLINITGGEDMTLFEVDEAANRIREEVDAEAQIIFGSAFNQHLEGKIRVSVVATGIDSEEYIQPVTLNRPHTHTPTPTPAAPIAAPQTTYQTTPSEEKDTTPANTTEEAPHISFPTTQQIQTNNQPSNTPKAAPFIPPQAAQPSNDTVASTATPPAAAPSSPIPAVTPSPITGEVPTEEDSEPGIFGRMADAARSFGYNFSEEAKQPPQQQQQEATKTTAENDEENNNTTNDNSESSRSEEELLDIPAFLRRK